MFDKYSQAEINCSW